MLEYLIHADERLFLLLNGLHTPFFDSLMWYISAKLTWLPLYVFVLYWLVRTYGYRKAAVLLVGFVLTLTLSDLLSVHLFKNTVQRLRPSHNPDFDGLIHLVRNYRGGLYGFVSSHAANSFGFAVFASFFIQGRWGKISLLAWAVTVSYSRIYLGVHYPGDVLGGALLGVVCAYLVYVLYQMLARKLTWLEAAKTN